MTRVCFVGAYDPAYPRNRILREGLARAGIEVAEARVRETRAFRRWPALAARLAREGRGAHVLLVPEFRHKDMPLARALRGRRPLIFDPLVSRWDTLVGDWKLHGERSAQARWNRMLDRWSLRGADRVLCDTWAHGELFISLGVPRERVRRVLVGAEDAFFEVPPALPGPEGPGGSNAPVRILYLGGFLPLHGVRVVLEAAALLRDRRAQLPPYALELVGTGIEHDEARARANSLGLSDVAFPGRTSYGDAPARLATAHIVLGAFGTGEKAGRVIPHKLWQGLAAARACVTGDGPGVREVFQHGEHLLTVPRGDAESLAIALASLIGDPAQRAALGAAGRARALELGTPDAVGASLAAVIAELRA